MLRPLRDNVLIKVKEEDDATPGGIIIPDTAKETPVEGTVEAVGNGRILDDGSTVPMTVKVGDTVIYSKWAGSDVNDPEGNEFKIIPEGDIYAVVE